MLQVLPKFVICFMPTLIVYHVLKILPNRKEIIAETNTYEEAVKKYFEWSEAESESTHEFVYDAKYDEYVLTEKYGYHKTSIAKGKLGEPSKIYEEVEEFKDAVNQGIEVMAILELADLIGAVECYLEEHHPTIKIEDLIRMKDVTKRAFSNGYRS